MPEHGECVLDNVTALACKTLEITGLWINCKVMKCLVCAVHQTKKDEIGSET